MFSFASIREFHQRLSRGETSCTEAVRYFLSRIGEHKALNAFAEVFQKEALERAALLDRQSSRGKLHGVVVGIKDNIHYQGHVVAAGSKMLQTYQAIYSSTAVERLMAEGAIIIGRQNCDEFGMGSTNENSFYGPVPNPHHPDLVAGGSSGGSAASVAAGLCMVSLGSDTGGSVRLPASFCGIVGFKPAYGRISRHGLIAYGSSFDQIGVLANSVEDVQILMEVLSGADEFDSTADPGNPYRENPDFKDHYRLAYFSSWIDHPSLDPEIRKAFLQKLNELRDAGFETEGIDFPLTDYIVPAYYVLTTAEASSNLARYDGARYGYQSAKIPVDLQDFYKTNRSEGFGREVKKRILLGSFVLSEGYYDAYYMKALQVRKLLREQTASILQKFDFILSPVSPYPPYKLGNKNMEDATVYLGDIFTVFASLCGISAISLPVFKHSSNIPFGLQVHSSPHNEVPLLRFSHQLMQQ